MKKGVIVFLLLVMSMVFCYSAGSSEESGEITITVWDFKYGEEIMGSAMKEIDKLYMEQNPNVIIEHLAQPHDQYYDLLRAGIASGEGPDVALGAVDARMWAYENRLVSLDNYIEDLRSAINEDVWQSCVAGEDEEKGIKLIPLTLQGVGWYYNKEKFAQVGLDPENPPTDWDDFLIACETLKNEGITPITWGNTPAYVSDWMRRSMATNFYGNNGIEGFETGESNFDDPEYVTVIEMINELNQKGYLDPKGASQPVFMDAIEQFKAGKGAMFLGLLSDIAHWKDFGDALGKENVGYFPNINHPDAEYKDRQMNQLAGIGYGVFNYSNNVDTAIDYVKFYGTAESQKILMEKTGAMVPNGNVDLSNLGYPALKDIISCLSTNSVADLKRYLSAEARQKSMDYDTLWLNAGELSVEEYIEKTQKVLNASRK